MPSLLIFLSLAVIPVFTLISDRCPKHWKHYKKGRSCYYVSGRKMEHYTAQAFCGKLSTKSMLLRIENEAENNFVAEQNWDGPMWVDAKARFDILDSAAGLFSPGFVLRWPNNRPLHFNNFGPGHGFRRLTSRNSCVSATSKASWLNTDCGGKAYAVCKRKAIPKRPHEHCPKHWHYKKETGACYRAIVKENMTMLTADIKCYETGADIHQDSMLASVGSQIENDFVLGLAKAKMPDFEFVMLGAFGHANDREKWNWLDGSNFTFHNWERGMPHGKRSLAVVVMNRRGKWINQYADKILSYYKAVAVCKYKP